MGAWWEAWEVICINVSLLIVAQCCYRPELKGTHLISAAGSRPCRCLASTSGSDSRGLGLSAFLASEADLDSDVGLGSDTAPVLADRSPARSLSFFLAIDGSGGDVDDVAPVFLFL